MNKIKGMLFIVILILLLSGCLKIEKRDAQLAFADHVSETESKYIDFQSLLNNLQVNYVQSNFKVINQLFGQSQSATGSGFIFFEDEAFYYLLTNEHVVNNDDNLFQTIKLMDYQDEEFTAIMMFSLKEYDLAVLRMEKTAKPFPIVPLANDDAKINDNVYVIGNPKHQVNTITIGRVLAFALVTIKSEGYIPFEVIVSSAPVQHGSSGGMMIDESGQLVAVVYAGNVSGSVFSTQSFAIPISKVREFLQVNNFSLGGQ
ncbi:MAG: serine protease [Acholeplasmataceae bacterium]